MEKWESVTWLCKQLGIGKTTAYGLIARGELPASKIGGVIRVKPSQIDRHMQRRRIKQGADAHRGN